MVQSLIKSLTFAVTLAFPYFANAVPVQESSSNIGILDDLPLVGDVTNRLSLGGQGHSNSGGLGPLSGLDTGSLLQSLDGLPIADQILKSLQLGGSTQMSQEGRNLISSLDTDALLQVLDDLPIGDKIMKNHHHQGGKGDPIEDLGVLLKESEDVVKATVVATVSILKSVLDPVVEI